MEKKMEKKNSFKKRLFFDEFFKNTYEFFQNYLIFRNALFAPKSYHKKRAKRAFFMVRYFVCLIKICSYLGLYNIMYNKDIKKNICKYIYRYEILL